VANRGTNAPALPLLFPFSERRRENDMDDDVSFYEQAQDLGEVVSNGLRYRIFFDSRRQRTVCFLVAGQERAVASALSGDTPRPA
jgi:hypothetical protein